MLSLLRRHEAGLGEARTSASALLVMAEHSGTHIDALCHQAEDLELHGGVEVDAAVQTSAGFTALGADTIPPLIARGVLLDVAGALGVERLPDGHAVSAAELEAARPTASSCGAATSCSCASAPARVWDDRAGLRGGGRDGRRRRRAGWPRASRWPSGPTTSPGTSRARATRSTGTTLPGHVLLIVRAGVYILESLNLEALAADGVREFAFVCLPLKLRGGTGSPVRPLALA